MDTINIKKKETVRFSISLPADLNEKVEAEMQKQGRDKNKQINWIVKKYYEPADSGESTQKATVS